MSDISDRTIPSPGKSRQMKSARWLVQVKAANGFKSVHFPIILVMLTIFAYIYFAVLTGFHDIYLIMFFYPLIYTALVYRLRGIVTGGITILGILLTHTLFFNYE